MARLAASWTSTERYIWICLNTYFAFHFQDSRRPPSSDNNESRLLSLPRLAGRKVSSSINSSSASERRQDYGLYLSIRNGRWLFVSRSRWRGVLQRDSICSATSWPTSPETPSENHFTTRHYRWHQDCGNLFTVHWPCSGFHRHFHAADYWCPQYHILPNFSPLERRLLDSQCVSPTRHQRGREVTGDFLDARGRV
jgi:hypothetical protein